MKIILLNIVILAFVSHIFPQTVSGKVTDSDLNPLEGVNIIIEGTDIGAASDEKGNYKITNLSNGNYTLKFSAVGYDDILKEVIIKNVPVVLNIVMYEKAVETQQVIVTAGKREQLISELPVSADVIPADEFSTKNFFNIENALRYVPGISMTEDQISIRGSSGYSRGAGSRVLLALDGIPFYTGDTGETIWEMIPTPVIERVEVIKGAASSLYGSTAIGGVINVITRDIPDEPATFIKSFMGVYDNPAHHEWKWSNETRFFNGLTLAHSQKFNNIGLEGSITRLEDMSYKENGFSHKYIGFLKGKFDITSASSITLLANTLNKKGGNFLYWKDSQNVLVPPDADEGQTVTTARYLFGAIYKNVINEDLLLNIKTSYYRTDWSDTSPAKDKSLSNLYRGEVQINKSFSNDLIIVTGIEGLTSNVKSNLFGNPDMISGGIYLQGDILYFSPLTVSAGIRYDYSKLDTLSAENAISPKIGLNYKVSDDLILRSSAGTGFRAPSLAEAFTSTSASGLIIKPNPDLKSEKNFNFEVGADYQPFGELKIDAALFQSEYYNFIEAGIDPSDGFAVFRNVTRARIQGLESDITTDLFNKSVKISMSYTYLWARDLNKHKALKYRPRNLFLGSIDYYILNIDFGADFRYWSRIEEIDDELVRIINDGDLRVAAYVLDLRVSYNLNSLGIPASIFLNADNVLNYNYVELIGNLRPIRNYSLSIQFNF
ncbi:MAG TPA: TonB-dependent receptor [Ignavibacteriaceae bacterium]|nr:TonB-dependent receptor [Ignavibacteriaceae bacterium]